MYMYVPLERVVWLLGRCLLSAMLSLLNVCTICPTGASAIHVAVTLQ